MATVLVIEDEEGILILVRRIITKLGHEVVGVGDGASAIQQAKARPFQLILTDFTLPDSPTGLDLVASLKEHQPGCPLIVATGLADTERVDALMALGVTRILRKPFDVAELRALLAEILPA